MAWLDGMWDNTPFGGGGFDYNEAARHIQTVAADRDAQVKAAIRRAQMESDREFDLKVQSAKREKERIAISRGQAEAERWWQRESAKLAREKLEEDRRQFDLEFGEDRRQFDLKFGEGQRQFNTTASGYLDGRPTLEREQFQDDSLRGWTDRAIQLSMSPRDWVALKRMNSGVSSNIGSIPGLAWASGGQVGNTAFAGTPQTNSLGNVQGNMGIGSGGSGGGWAGSAAQLADSIANANPNLTPQEQQIHQTADQFARNPQGSAPGWWESLDPLTQSLLEGAGQAQGHDWSTAMSRYRRSQWGGGGNSRAA